MPIVSEIKKADISEKLAVFALVIKVGQFLGESLHYKTKFPAAFEGASFISVFLFGVSLVLWLHSSRKKLDRLDDIAARVDGIKGDVDKFDTIARYGMGPVHLVARRNEIVSMEESAGGHRNTST